MITQNRRLPDSELEIMLLIWDINGPVTSALISDRLKKSREWKITTVLTFLNRLAKKGFITYKREGKVNIYDALIDEHEYLESIDRSELKISLAKMRRILMQAVNSLRTTSDIRDPFTAGHQKKVAKLAMAIAVEMGLSPNQIEGISVAGNLHDIGKINVPSEILSKPGILSDLEFALIKTHCQSGYEIVKDIEFPWPVAEVLLQHHERMNGSGYPRRLMGDTILIESRIIAVADVVEAMASHRPYRPALGIETALNEIIQNKGILYDPIVVDACLKLFRENDFIFE